MRPVGNALELKLCKIPTIGTQSENQTLPTGNISLGSPIVFSGWALHWSIGNQLMPLSVFHNQNKKAKLVIISHNALLGS
ncbi:hypothetical protein FIM42_01380 [Helicobacter pylori]|uniref:hypothetical protein n=1 Tax=Helicobacter pylori TaxID=210 RepID=UPI000EAD5B3C|nr:hypothetical protein FIM49_01215 [Helicobacter pylori]TPH96769.1 hypothetical protein FIM42_01380 [Helicobacter pylori]TPI03136.1 hypothetical protein FIM41_04775 [Helicobacter pylori]